MSASNPWSLIAVGCGTANLACVQELAASPAAARLERVTLVDPAVIRQINALTCPEYAGYQGKPKVERLAELVQEWFGGVSTSALHNCLEELDWDRLLSPGDAGGVPPAPLVVLIGLDDWGARLRMVGILRHAAGLRTALVPIQVAIDRDQAQVTVLGNAWLDACPACGIFPLPEEEPCALVQEGRLVRGDLQREVRAAAALVARIVANVLSAGSAASPWVGTKSNLYAVPPGGSQFQRKTRRRSRVAGCMGPHEPATPLRPQELLR